MSKTCPKCKTLKTSVEFHKNSRRKDGVERICKICKNEENTNWRNSNKATAAAQQKEWRAKNPEKRKINSFAYRNRHPQRIKSAYFERTYGISLVEYDILFNRQLGCCAICGRHQDQLKSKLAVDHNHDSGEIRGLLCQSCNTGIGSLRSDKGVEILKRAVRYIENSK